MMSSCDFIIRRITLEENEDRIDFPLLRAHKYKGLVGHCQAIIISYIHGQMKETWMELSPGAKLRGGKHTECGTGAH